MRTSPIAQIALSNAIDQFETYKLMAEKAIHQIDDAALFARSDEDANSIAIIMKHMAGNMRSRWRDFLTTDGEKPDRDRDTEFEMDTGATREEILVVWENGWRVLFETLYTLSLEDISASVVIRGDKHLVIEAIMRQLTHYAYHVGQIVLLARSEAGADWKSLSVPRGESDSFNERLWGTHAASNPVQRPQ